jgi:hypothetical protein
MSAIVKDNVAIRIERWAEMADGCPSRINVYGIDPGMMCKAIHDWCNFDNCMFKHWGAV